MSLILLFRQTGYRLFLAFALHSLDAFDVCSTLSQNSLKSFRFVLSVTLFYAVSVFLCLGGSPCFSCSPGSVVLGYVPRRGDCPNQTADHIYMSMVTLLRPFTTTSSSSSFVISPLTYRWAMLLLGYLT